MTVAVWMPAESAPKDGTVILAYGYFAGEVNGPDNDPSMCVIVWSGGRTDYPGYDWRVTNTDAYAEWFKPLAWTVLPQINEAEWQ